MFTRADFLEALAGMTSIDQGDLWGMLGYLLIMGPCGRRVLRHAFWPVQGGFDAKLHFLVRHHAVELLPDRFEGEPMIRVNPKIVEIVESSNRAKIAEKAK